MLHKVYLNDRFILSKFFVVLCNEENLLVTAEETYTAKIVHCCLCLSITSYAHAI